MWRATRGLGMTAALRHIEDARASKTARPGISVDPTARLRIATRIHFALLRHFGESVDIRLLLAGGAECQEALAVCEASGDRYMMALGRQFAGGGVRLPTNSVPSLSDFHDPIVMPMRSSNRVRKYSCGVRRRDASLCASTAPKTCSGMPP